MKHARENKKRTSFSVLPHDFFLAILEGNPQDAEAHCHLGDVLKNLGLLDEAIICFEEAVQITPQYAAAHGSMGVVLHILNALAGIQTDSPPVQYVTNLFDGYALRFEESLAVMGYEIPMLLSRALDTLAGPARFAKAVDLGCGTGLSGLAFREKAAHLTGVDLSSRMLAIASEKEIYDALRQKDLVRFLCRSAEFYDLFLLTDVCIYLGNLAPVFVAIRQRTRPGALVFFHRTLPASRFRAQVLGPLCPLPGLYRTTGHGKRHGRRASGSGRYPQGQGSVD
ncbi:MAG: hypothetical protein A2521_07905 [Deltaproteobacteria bacterium RIFOXYD12_FULL_57_12]|nr:MAG: hypothetical protein A2521_07905 [Deltaproteobacteria bacterium RIFOXYD12_FULL_57_12]